MRVATQEECAGFELLVGCVVASAAAGRAGTPMSDSAR